MFYVLNLMLAKVPHYTIFFPPLTHKHTHYDTHTCTHAHTPYSTQPLNVETGCDGVELETPVEFEISVTLNNCDNFPETTSAYR